jgi:hypothetical protein
MVITMYARLIENKVVEVINHQPVGYPADFEWVECPKGTEARSTYDPKTKKFKAFVLPSRATKLETNGAKVEGEALNDPNLTEPKDRDPDAPRPI